MEWEDVAENTWRLELEDGSYLYRFGSSCLRSMPRSKPEPSRSCGTSSLIASTVSASAWKPPAGCREAIDEALSMARDEVHERLKPTSRRVPSCATFLVGWSKSLNYPTNAVPKQQ
jgi:hypothetical protein